MDEFIISWESGEEINCFLFLKILFVLYNNLVKSWLTMYNVFAYFFIFYMDNLILDKVMFLVAKVDPLDKAQN